MPLVRQGSIKKASSATFATLVVADFVGLVAAEDQIVALAAGDPVELRSFVRQVGAAEQGIVAGPAVDRNDVVALAAIGE